MAQTWWLPRETTLRAELEIKKSRFIATLARTDDETTARDQIAAVRAEFPDARHNCTAFRVTEPGALVVERSSDDGEPAGTAGMPMLEVLRGADVEQITAVVTRYFGGILLGTGGLVRAYSDAVQAALADAPKVRPVVWQLAGLTVSAADAGRIDGLLRGHDFDVIDTRWGAEVSLTLAVPDIAETLPTVRQLLQSDVDLLNLGTFTREVPLV